MFNLLMQIFRKDLKNDSVFHPSKYNIEEYYPTKITNNIWLGGNQYFPHSDDPLVDDNGQYFINLNDIEVVVSLVTRHELPRFTSSINKENFLHIPICDFDDEDIFPYIDKFNEFMDNRINKNIYIHCAKGMSRSVTFLIIYLMLKENIYDYNIILDKIKSKRNIVDPNPGFIKSLEIYQEWLKSNRYFTLTDFRDRYPWITTVKNN